MPKNPDYSDGLHREPFPGATFLALIAFAIVLSAGMFLACNREDKREAANDAAISAVRESAR